MKPSQRIVIEFKPDLTHPYLVSVVGALNMRELIGHFATPADVRKCLTVQLGIGPQEIEKAIADLHANGRAHLTRLVQG
jgi:hypothetical protein